MSKETDETESSGPAPEISKEACKDSLHKLRIQLVKLQRHFIQCDDKILILFEGRGAAGKDGTIKRIVGHLSPREIRVVALGKPSDRDRTSCYFQRYVPYLPAAQGLVLFNRSWYNRVGVAQVMGFCTEAEYQEFMGSVSDFEHMLMHSGIKLLKYYLDISKPEQKQCMNERKSDPLTPWKVSTLDNLARDEMLAHTHNAIAPWTIVGADDKQLARLNIIIKNLLSQLRYADKDERLILPDPDVVFNIRRNVFEKRHDCSVNQACGGGQGSLMNNLNIPALVVSGSSALLAINAPMLKRTKLAGIRRPGEAAATVAAQVPV